jgi:hypothetical protein
MNSQNELHEFAMMVLSLVLGVVATYAVALEFARMSGFPQ